MVVDMIRHRPPMMIEAVGWIEIEDDPNFVVVRIHITVVSPQYMTMIDIVIVMRVGIVILLLRYPHRIPTIISVRLVAADLDHRLLYTDVGIPMKRPIE